jgi:hypothetical protein
LFNLTLTEKASFAALIAAFLLVCLPFGLSYTRDEPFVLYGKEFGFGTGTLKKAQSDLTACNQRLDNTTSEALALLDKARSENQQLKQANAILLKQEESRNLKSSKMWFPVDNVTFYEDGKFITQEGAEQKGKWSHRNSELTLRLVALAGDEIVLATNLPEPGNLLRISKSSPVLVYMTKWDYQLSMKTQYPDNAEIQIERQPK